MTLIVADRVAHTTPQTGTGFLSLSAPITGFQSLSAVCADGDTFPYVIFAVDDDNNPSGDWECGIGTFGTPNVITRTTVTASSNSGSAVDFQDGIKHVYLDMTAGMVAKATAAQYRANSNDNALSPNTVWSAAQLVPLAAVSTVVAVNLSSGINFSLSMEDDYTLANPTNAKPGQQGYIKITQTAGNTALAFDTRYKWTGGVEQEISVGGDAIDILYYNVIDSFTIHVTLCKDIRAV